MPSDGRPFPIQGETTSTRPVRHFMPTHIPWWLAEIAYEHYSNRYGKDQTLAQLAERGGFGRDELVKLIQREW